MLVFISGSINAGKTTTSSLLAKKLGWAYINVDDLTDKVSGFDIYKHLDLAMDLAIQTINKTAIKHTNIVANFVVRKEDYIRLEREVTVHPQVFITLCPGLTVAQSQRGDRTLTDWEVKRIQAHYDQGIASPDYGHIIDNANLTIEETVEQIEALIAEYSH